MAAGGTLARKYVQEYRPHAIVAIACERDLNKRYTGYKSNSGTRGYK